jgi:hypothetical protein
MRRWQSADDGRRPEAGGWASERSGGRWISTVARLPSTREGGGEGRWAEAGPSLVGRGAEDGIRSSQVASDVRPRRAQRSRAAMGDRVRVRG